MAAKKRSTKAVSSTVPPDRLDLHERAVHQLEYLGIAVERIARKLHNGDLPEIENPEAEFAALIAIGGRVEALSKAAAAAVHSQEHLGTLEAVVDGMDS
jgi:hypothetical protein